MSRGDSVRRGERVFGGAGGLPTVGEKLIELADRRGGDAGQDVAEAGVRMDFVALTGGDEAE